ncbi:nudix hydrolase 14 [Bisporella sp. PMI_857]|nr:nudix hydrolase 14 [Bisporella sp. PMI_857]
MSTFTLANTSTTVQLIPDLSQEQLLAFPAFKNWLSQLTHSLSKQSSPTHPFHSAPYSLESITIQSADRWGPSKRIGFLKLQATIKNVKGTSLPGGIFLRGPAVGMLVILQPDDLPKENQDEKYVLLTVQPRIPCGSLQFVELPAGMVDNGTFKGIAAQEIKEELGIDIPEKELINLSELAFTSEPAQTIEEEDREGQEGLPQAMFPSAGGCDEYIQIFLHEKRVPRSKLKEWEGKFTGLMDQGEMITLKVVKLEDLWLEGARDSKALTAWALYSGLKLKGKL